MPALPRGLRASSGSATPGTGWSVRTYLVLIVLCGVVALAAASVYGFVWSAQQAREDAVTEMGLLADRAAASIAAAASQATEVVEGVAAQPGLEAVFTDPAGCTLSVQGPGPFPSARLDVVRADGLVACSSAPSPAVNAPAVHAGSAWLTDALGASGTTLQWSAIDAVAGEPALVVTAPVAPAGEPLGTVVAFLHLRPAASAMEADVAMAERPSFTLVDASTGTVLSASAVDLVARGGPLEFPVSLSEGQWDGIDGSARLFGSAAVPGGDWRVYAGMPRSTVLAGARGALSRQAQVGLVALLLLAAAALILNRRVAGPLRRVTQAVVRAGAAPDGVRVEERGTAELVALARQFNTMLDIRAGHEAQLAYQATHDALTGLPNRALLDERLGAVLGQERDEACVALLAFGIDRFSRINDSLGHEVGDRLLIDVAARLSTALRPGDTLARLGGDVFVVLCEDVSEEGAVLAAERLHGCVDEPFQGPDSPVVLQAAIGVAVARGSGVTPEQLLTQVDSAMHQAKGTASHWCMFEPSMQRRATRRLALESDLRQALERGELFLHYQPLIDIATGRTVAAEALVRWQLPGKGLIPPLEFIPIAEDTGQIGRVGRFVLTQACHQAAAWNAAGHELRISVNVAAGQLRHGGFPNLVAQVLADAGLAPDQLCIEITESSLMTASEQSAHDLGQLRETGVHIAIDDFGTGYSSLSYLHELPVSELKIDRSFTSRAGVDSRDNHMLEAILGMAHALGLTVVAEGVETGAQLEFLAELHCQLAQGYLFAKPEPPDQLLAKLEARRVPARA